MIVARICLGFRRHKIIVDGYTWHYLDSGAIVGCDTLVLVHGFGADKDSWLPYARFFTRRYRVICVDLPGFGEGVRDPDLDYTAKVQGERLQRFIEKLALGRVHFAGNSMGGMVVKHIGIQSPKFPLSLLFMNSGGVASQQKSQLELAVEKGENPLLIRSINELDDLLNLATHEPKKLPGFMKRYMFNQMQDGFDFYNSIFWSLVEDGGSPDLTPQLSRIEAPVLILWGEHDQLLDVSCARALNRELPNSTLVIFNNVGHAPMMEVPARAAAEHLKFLSAVSAAQSAL